MYQSTQGPWWKGISKSFTVCTKMYNLQVWAVGVDKFRIISGGRGGEVRVWGMSCQAGELVGNGKGTPEGEDNEESRVLFFHPKSTSVAALYLDR